MAIINHPIALNSTAQSILTEMDRETALYAAYAEDQRRTVYNDIGALANVVRGNSVEQNRKLFPEGDQIIVPWKDMDDENHNTDETAYQIAMDIVHHGNVELEDGEIVPGMFLQWHKCSPYGVQFSNYQAFMNCPDGLEAGTYSISFAQTWSKAVAQVYNFTLTQAVPAGGRLSGFQLGADTAPANYTVKSWASPTASSPIETVAVSIGASGTDLGTLAYTQSSNGLNCMQKVMDGSNRWSTSAIRQYLNKSGANWFASAEDFDIRPDQYTKKGFLTGFADDFIAATRPIKISTALNTVEGYENASEVTCDRIFLPSLEQMNATPQLATVEGPHFEYWRRRLGLSGFASCHPSIYDEYKIPAINSDSPQTVRLRSAYRGRAYHTWIVNSSGYVYYGYAYYAFRFSPVCVIA